MPNLKCAKPASVGAEPAPKIDLLGGGVDLANSIFPGPSQAPASRRLVGARYSPAEHERQHARWEQEIIDRLTVETLAWVRTCCNADQTVGDYIGQLVYGFNIVGSADTTARLSQHQKAQSIARLPMQSKLSS
jgi:hypothetical protein